MKDPFAKERIGLVICLGICTLMGITLVLIHQYLLVLLFLIPESGCIYCTYLINNKQKKLKR